MSGLRGILRSLNRKERFAVLNEVLGFDREAPCLDSRFRDELERRIGEPVPECCFLAMDYHLDWIEMALYLAGEPEIQPGCRFRNQDFQNINENQEDVDLFVAFEGDGAGRKTTHLVLIEAKAYLPWSKPQLDSKAKRLRSIFGEHGTRWDSVTPHFVLMTGETSIRICTRSWPNWMSDGDKPFWMQYELPSRNKITRCTVSGKRSKGGGYLRLD